MSESGETVSPSALLADAMRLGLSQAGPVRPLGCRLEEALSEQARNDLRLLLKKIVRSKMRFVHETKNSGLKKARLRQVERRILDSYGDFGGARVFVAAADDAVTQVGSLADLLAVEAVDSREDPTGLDAPDVARTLIAFCAAGFRFILDEDDEPYVESVVLQGERTLANLGRERARHTGTYGAWREVAVMKAQRLWMHREESTPMPLHSPRDVALAAYFELGAPSSDFTPDAFSAQIHELTERGFTFHSVRRECHASAVYDEFNRDESAHIQLAVQGVAPEDLHNAPGTVPLSSRLMELSAFYCDHVRHRLEKNSFTRQDARAWVDAASRSVGAFDIGRRARVLEELFAFEASIGTSPADRPSSAAWTLCIIDKLLQPEDNPEAVVQDVMSLRRQGLSMPVVPDLLKHFRTIRRWSLDSSDVAEQQAQLLESIEVAGCYEKGREALELIECTLPFPDGIAVLRAILTMHRSVQVAPASGEKASTVDQFDQVLEDYRAVVTHRLPEERVASAATAMAAMHAVLVPSQGWERSRNAFAFIQRGTARRTFGSLTRDGAVAAFLEHFALRSDLSACRAHLMRLGEQERTMPIQMDPSTNEVIVNGIRLPRRKSDPDGAPL